MWPKLPGVLLLLALGAALGEASPSPPEFQEGKKRAEEARARAQQRAKEGREQANKRREEMRERGHRAKDVARTHEKTGEIVKLCEEQKKKAMLTWQKTSELSELMRIEEKAQEVLTGQGQEKLQRLFRPPVLHPMGYVRAGHVPKDIRQRLLHHLHHHRKRMFADSFTPILGNQRKAMALPLLPDWTRKGGFIDRGLRPLVEKASGKKMDLVLVAPSIRVYEDGASLMAHVDSPDRPVTVAIPLEATGAGMKWHLEMSDPHGRNRRPLPLQPGQMLIYEGARLPHGRPGQLLGGELSVLFAYYRPAENYDEQKIRKGVEQLLASRNVPRGPSRSPPKPPPSQKPKKEFRSADEL